jgi:hypothetical protein
MRSGTAEVIEDGPVRAADLFEGVSKNGKLIAEKFTHRQVSLFVGGNGEVVHGWREPCGVYPCRIKRTAEDASK